MHKWLRYSFAFLFVIIFAAMSVGTSQAIFFTPIVWDDPVVIPGLSSDTAVATTVAQPALPGTEKNDKGQYLPVGFVTGEAQFGGKGLVVSNMIGSKATICFSFPLYKYEWSGDVRMWNGTKWMKLPTTITEGTESDPTWACAEIYGNGTYALIIGFWGTPKVEIQAIEIILDDPPVN